VKRSWERAARLLEQPLVPWLFILLVALPIAASAFALGARYSLSKLSVQALFYLLDGLIVVYLSLVVRRVLGRLRSANDEIVQQAARTRAVIDLAPDAFFQSDLEARFTDVNQAACRLLGYQRDELLGKTIFDTILEEDAPRLMDTRSALLVGREITAEWTLRRKDGSLVPVEVSAKILPDGRWQAFVRDISERKRVESQLRESEERFRLIFDEAPIGMALVTLDGSFVRVNRTFCAIVGYPAEELEQLRFADITHPDDVYADVALAGKLARGEIARYQLQKRYLRKDGSVVDTMLGRSMLRDRDGASRYFITQIEDISDRQRADIALRQSESQFRGLIEHMPDGVFVYNEGRISYLNPAMAALLGYERAALVGKPIMDLLPPEERAPISDRIRMLQETGRPTPPRETHFLRRDGSICSAETAGMQIEFEGQPGLVVIVRDLTLRKQAEAALRRALAARDQVLGIVAHDLRNPLATIIMASGALEQESRPKEIIKRAATRMNRLIQDLLDVALLEAGQLKVLRLPISARELLVEAVEMQRSLASSSQVQVQVEIEGDLPAILGDRDRLLQVFENLIGNALKFTGAGGRITVSAIPGDGEVLFSVADTGCGIAPSQVGHIFDPFWQAAASKGRLGAGLGLPITRGIVEAHGGKIWVESALGRGSRFVFVIPSTGTSGDRRVATMH
jgi:PAS domain S-box-containing protein